MVSAHTSCNGREDDPFFPGSYASSPPHKSQPSKKEKKKVKKAFCNAPPTCFSRISHSTRTKEQKLYLKKITIMMPTCPSSFMIQSSINT